MRECPVILDLKLDKKSLKAIDEINEIYDLKKIGRYAMFMGHIYSIFGGSLNRGATGSGISGIMNAIPNNVVKKSATVAGKVVTSEANQTSYSIYQANWKYFYESFSAFDKIALEAIEKIAYREASSHQSSPKEYKFWKSVYLGCEANVK